MKTVKTKSHHHHRKSKATPPPAVALMPDASMIDTEIELQLYRLERSPKQENL